MFLTAREEARALECVVTLFKCFSRFETFVVTSIAQRFDIFGQKHFRLRTVETVKEIHGMSGE